MVLCTVLSLLLHFCKNICCLLLGAVRVVGMSMRLSFMYSYLGRESFARRLYSWWQFFIDCIYHFVISVELLMLFCLATYFCFAFSFLLWAFLLDCHSFFKAVWLWSIWSFDAAFLSLCCVSRSCFNEVLEIKCYFLCLSVLFLSVSFLLVSSHDLIVYWWARTRVFALWSLGFFEVDQNLFSTGVSSVLEGI